MVRIFWGLLLLALAVLDTTPAAAQRPANWVLLGEQTVGFRTDNDAIDIGQSEEWFKNRSFRMLHFVVERNDIELREITIVYLNGHSETLQIGRKVRRGTSIAVDLRGQRSYLKQIRMRYRAQLSLRGLAEVKVYGELAGPVGPPPVAAGWSEIDTQVYDRLSQRIVLSAQRGDGSFGQISFRAIGEPVRLFRVHVRFQNGDTQSIDVAEMLAPGAQSRPIDIEGYRRRIESVAVDLRSDPRGGPGRLVLLGTARPGGPEPVPAIDPSWVRLGTRTVGPGLEREVIRVGQGEDFYRNRRFGVLHVTTERAELHIARMRVTYLNGYTEELQADRLLRPGETLALRLGGERSYIAEVELTLRARPGGGAALVSLFGEPARAPVPREPQLLGRQTVGLFGDRDVILVGQQEGRFRQIQLRVLRNDIELLDLRVFYANGAVEDIPVRRYIRRDQSTPPLDLRGGEARAINRVELSYRSRPNLRGEAVVELFGIE